MVGMWVMYLFMSTITSTTIDGNLKTGISGTAGLIAILFIKAVIIYKAVDVLNNYGRENCEDGEAFADKISGVTAFASGG